MCLKQFKMAETALLLYEAYPLKNNMGYQFNTTNINLLKHLIKLNKLI